MTAIAQDRVDLERTIQAHRKEIDRQPGDMQTLHEEVVQLSRSFNAMSFVSRLPREVIYPIFWEYLYNSQKPLEVQAFGESNVHDARGLIGNGSSSLKCATPGGPLHYPAQPCGPNWTRGFPDTRVSSKYLFLSRAKPLSMSQ
ncbi:hypothetical protein QCA50_013615 [Cerrena zonata]|uniref:Uncharacterized protein n=1 Tax=Cerrena zonata TaxID=2478898 RepID=A0AAW0FQL3_9APHY